MTTKIVSIHNNSSMLVIDTDIEFFINKIAQKEYFTYSRISVEWWMLLVGAFKRLGYKNVESIDALDKDYIIKNIDSIVDKMIEHWNERQSSAGGGINAKGARPWKFNHKVFVDIIKMIISPKKDNFLFAICERAFYKKDLPALNGNSLLDAVINNVLPAGETPYNALCFRRWGQNGHIRKLISSIDSKQVVLVGPYIYKDLGKRAGFKNYTHIEVDHSEGTFYVQKYYKQIIKLHNKLLRDEKDIIYLFTCGSVGLWLINELHGKLNKCFMLDMGRSLDAYLYYTRIKKIAPSWIWGQWLDKNKPYWAKDLNNTSGRWVKKGLIYNVNGKYIWNKSHAQIPIVDKRFSDKWRIYYSSRDSINRSSISFIDVEPGKPQNILYEHNRPVLSPGKLGAFDDCGTMPTSIVNLGSCKYMYYIGWTIKKTIPYHNSIGLAKSIDGGETFTRIREGPIVGPTSIEPYFTGTANVIKLNDNDWRMWYLSCTKWEEIGDMIEPFYHIKYATSLNGIDWKHCGVAIDYKSNEEGGISSASVLVKNNLFHMWFSYRGKQGYRDNKKNSYRIGYAQSVDSIKWKRNDFLAGIDVSNSGWDSEMIAYPCIIEYNNRKYMFYNGNGFGQSGFGYAIEEEKNEF